VEGCGYSFHGVNWVQHRGCEKDYNVILFSIFINWMHSFTGGAINLVVLPYIIVVLVEEGAEVTVMYVPLIESGGAYSAVTELVA